tara:strand:- start:2072 stop:2422 length:351 start_codon:yes stop_codon:yes gene_type:complete
MKTFSKLFAVVFAILSVVSAYLQLNDPDPELWISIYIISAVASMLFILNKLPYQVYLVLFVGCIVGAYLFWPTAFEGVTIGNGDINNIEHARESLGLLIVGLVMLLFTVRTKRKGN